LRRRNSKMVRALSACSSVTSSFFARTASSAAFSFSRATCFCVRATRVGCCRLPTWPCTGGEPSLASTRKRTRPGGGRDPWGLLSWPGGIPGLRLRLRLERRCRARPRCLSRRTCVAGGAASVASAAPIAFWRRSASRALASTVPMFSLLLCQEISGRGGGVSVPATSSGSARLAMTKLAPSPGVAASMVRTFLTSRKASTSPGFGAGSTVDHSREFNVRLFMPCAGPGGGVAVPDTTEWCGLLDSSVPSPSLGNSQSASSFRCCRVGWAALLKGAGSCCS